jgi:hypothetical protein
MSFMILVLGVLVAGVAGAIIVAGKRAPDNANKDHGPWWF